MLNTNTCKKIQNWLEYRNKMSHDDPGFTAKKYEEYDLPEKLRDVMKFVAWDRDIMREYDLDVKGAFDVASRRRIDDLVQHPCEVCVCVLRLCG